MTSYLVDPAFTDVHRTTLVSLQDLYDTFSVLKPLWKRSTVEWLRYKHRLIREEIQLVTQQTARYRHITDQWFDTLATISEDQDDHNTFGSNQVWDVIKDHYSDFFTHEKRVARLRELETRMRHVLLRGDDQAVQDYLDRLVTTTGRSNRHTSSSNTLDRWLEGRMTLLHQTLGDILVRSTGCERQWARVGFLLRAFAYDWRMAVDANFNFIIVGPSGSGKSTFAHQLSLLMAYVGLLFDGNVHTVHRSDFVGQYVGTTAPKTLALLESARESVVFLDEAYDLAQCHQQSDAPARRCRQWDVYSQEAMTAIVAFLSANHGRIMFIAAGYRQEMLDTFLLINQGIPRRFQPLIEMQPLTDDALVKIFLQRLNPLDPTDDVKVDGAVVEVLREFLRHDPVVGGQRELLRYEGADMVELANRTLVALAASNESDLTPTLMDAVLSDFALERVGLGRPAPKNQTSNKCRGSGGRGKRRRRNTNG